ncbi:ABC transporter ATP-binding protein [Ancylobacter defluvii]|uniref:ABC transporter ATP-binding protein n=1 Tax=Ancylobacter defluvii TaxID=1282440 RepID=A0A9W6K3V0_9HYPH|nr:ABC transporter ATP-binding protein [Ancylobacter defluvii]MBS7588091.1 ABC transporter ATP-binding protein [Ancylobacter defluvii]GLK86483.1 ABC transporter ATP-binding protein [Ancylobacter defluvii]
MSSIAFESVFKRYGEVDAVRELNLTCAAGEMLALLGPSGCGKSTTLKMAAGIESVSSGEIWFGDKPVSRLAPGERNIAMVFEDYALYPNMTVWENVGFPLKVRGITGQPASQRIGEVLQLLGLRQMADQPVRGLSGGAMQRVSIGRALVRDPEVILFDEPLSHLDADQKVQLRAEIKRLQKLRQVTSILVTHDQTEAIAMADRVAVMNHGVLQQVGAPQDLYERPANLFVANFIGEPPMNLMKAAYAGNRIVGEGWEVTLTTARRAKLPDGAIVAGIRPEHVTVSAPDVAGDAGGAARGTIIYREPRGDADVLTVALDAGSGPGGKLVAEIAGPTAWRAGDKVSVGLDVGRLLVFDAASEKNLEVAP